MHSQKTKHFDHARFFFCYSYSVQIPIFTRFYPYVGSKIEECALHLLNVGILKTVTPLLVI